MGVCLSDPSVSAASASAAANTKTKVEAYHPTASPKPRMGSGPLPPNVSALDLTGMENTMEWRIKGLSKHLSLSADDTAEASVHLTSPPFVVGDQHSFVLKVYPFESAPLYSGIGHGDGIDADTTAVSRCVGAYVVSNDYDSLPVRVAGVLTIAHPSDSKQDYAYAFGPVRIDYHNAWGFPNAISRESALKRALSADDTLVLRLHLRVLVQHRRNSLTAPRAGAPATAMAVIPHPTAAAAATAVAVVPNVTHTKQTHRLDEWRWQCNGSGNPLNYPPM